MLVLNYLPNNVSLPLSIGFYYSNVRGEPELYLYNELRQPVERACGSGCERVKRNCIQILI